MGLGRARVRATGNRAASRRLPKSGHLLAGWLSPSRSWAEKRTVFGRDTSLINFRHEQRADIEQNVLVHHCRKAIARDGDSSLIFTPSRLLNDADVLLCGEREKRMLHGVTVILDRQRIENIRNEKILIGMPIRQERRVEALEDSSIESFRAFREYQPIFDISGIQTQSSPFREYLIVRYSGIIVRYSQE